MKERLKAYFTQVKWIVMTWRHVPPWTKFFVRYALTRHQNFGDYDRRGNMAWTLARRLTWDRDSMQRYAMTCLIYGLATKAAKK